MTQPGPFIVIEGIDGAGTTTQILRYAEYLRSRGRMVHVTRQPSVGPIGGLIRQGLNGRVRLDPATLAPIMALLFAADRIDHVAMEIEPLLREGTVVLCDRYDLSSIAYQTATAPAELLARFDFEAWIRELNRLARRPDLTLVVNVSPEVAERRRHVRGGPPDIYEVSDLQRRLAALYRDAERLCPNDRIVHLDGDPSLDDVAEGIRRVLDPIVFGA